MPAAVVWLLFVHGSLALAGGRFGDIVVVSINVYIFSLSLKELKKEKVHYLRTLSPLSVEIVR